MSVHPLSSKTKTNWADDVEEAGENLPLFLQGHSSRRHLYGRSEWDPSLTCSFSHARVAVHWLADALPPTTRTTGPDGIETIVEWKLNEEGKKVKVCGIPLKRQEKEE